MNQAKDLLSKHDVFCKIVAENYSKSEFLNYCYQQIPISDLPEAINFLKENKKKLSQISENLIIKNMESIIRDGKRIEDIQIADYEKLETQISSVKTGIQKLIFNYAKKIQKVEDSLQMLKNIYKVKKLAKNYKKLIELIKELAQMATKKNDLITMSEKCGEALTILEKHDFLGLKFYKKNRKIMEGLYSNVITEVKNKLEKSLETQN